jgi:hypothetical protein
VKKLGLNIGLLTIFTQSQKLDQISITSRAFGAVLAVPVAGVLLAMKTLEKSLHAADNPHLVPVYTEVSILEQCIGTGL